MFFQVNARCIWDLIEMCFWELQNYEHGPEKADSYLKAAREWKPEHGERFVVKKPARRRVVEADSPKPLRTKPRR